MEAEGVCSSTGELADNDAGWVDVAVDCATCTVACCSPLSHPCHPYSLTLANLT